MGQKIVTCGFDVVPVREVLFGVPITIFYIGTLKFSKNRHFGDRF